MPPRTATQVVRFEVLRDNARPGGRWPHLRLLPMSDPLPSDVTILLQRSAEGDLRARDRLLEVLHSELRTRAARCMAAQPGHHTLQATALVNETYLRLFGAGGGAWNDRSHFLAAASRAMRHVLVDHARGRGRDKRRAGGDQVPLDQIAVGYRENAYDLEALDRALEKLAEFNPEMARAVELRFFGGASVDEAARLCGLTRRTFERRWQVARAWLHAEVR